MLKSQYIIYKKFINIVDNLWDFFLKILFWAVLDSYKDQVKSTEGGDCIQYLLINYNGKVSDKEYV